MSFIKIHTRLKNNIPDEWAFYSGLGSKVMLVKNNNNQIGVLKLSSDAIVSRLKEIEKYGHTPKVYYYGNGITILEYIAGTNWKIYLDSHELTDELAKWYIIENIKIYNAIGSHGDFVWYNVLVTPNMEIKWIDIGLGNTLEQFINQLYYHLYKKYSEEYIYSLIG